MVTERHSAINLRLYRSMSDPPPLYFLFKYVFYVGYHVDLFVFKSNNDERMWYLDDLIMEYIVLC